MKTTYHIAADDNTTAAVKNFRDDIVAELLRRRGAVESAAAGARTVKESARYAGEMSVFTNVAIFLQNIQID